MGLGLAPRGHGLIVIEVKNASGQTHGRLTMVDLAGMESSKKSSAVEGPSNLPIRKEEAKRRRVEAQRDELKAEVARLTGEVNSRSRKYSAEKDELYTLPPCTHLGLSEFVTIC